VTAAILAMCSIAFGWELVLLAQGGDAALALLFERRGLVPADLVAALQAGDYLSGPTLDLFTHVFLHGSWLHLMGNMLFLWIFAVNVEDRLRRPMFAAFFLVGGIAAAAGHVLVEPTSEIPMIGASGAISAVLGAYLVLFPGARIQSLVFLVFFYELIAVPAIVVLGFWFVLQLMDGLVSLGPAAGTDVGIAFWAHIGGFLAGVAMAIPLRYRRGADALYPAPGRAVEPAPVPSPDPGPPPPPPPPPPSPALR
jgi:membrane associated rhomboid family serine protease